MVFWRSCAKPFQVMPLLRSGGFDDLQWCDPETREFFNELHRKAAPQREDIATWFDLLDLDDHVSYGGKA